jgi:pyruvate kinase
MLSGETSVGAYPVEAVEYMDRIVRAIEENGVTAVKSGHEVPDDAELNVADAIGRASCEIAEQIGAGAIVSLTTSGGTARVIAKYRPAVPILALTDRTQTMRELAFTWGVTPVAIPPLADMRYELDGLREHVLATGLVAKGQLVVYSAGSPLQKRVTTNMLEVHTL